MNPIKKIVGLEFFLNLIKLLIPLLTDVTDVCYNVQFVYRHRSETVTEPACRDKAVSLQLS